MWLEYVYKAIIKLKMSFRKIRYTFLSGIQKKRVPIVLQMNMVECGAACLTMILNYYEYWIQLSELRKQFNIGRDGTNAYDIVRVAQFYNFKVKAFSIEPEQLDQISLPAIAHWNFNHFVVIEEVDRNGVTIVNPASGMTKLSFEEFSNSFTGVVLVFEPTEYFRPLQKSKTPYWLTQLSAVANIFEVSSLFRSVIIASFVLQLSGLGGPLLTQLLVDQVLPLFMTDIMWILMVGILLLVFFQAITRYIRAILLIHLQARVDSQIMLGFTEHLFSLPFSFFQKRSNGDLLMRLGSNSVVREILMSQTMSIILDGSLTIIYMLVLFILAPVFGFLTLFLSLCQILILGFTAPKINALTEKDLLAQAESQSFLVESLAVMKQLKAIGGEKQALESWSKLFFKQLNVSIKRSHLTSSVDTIFYALQRATPLILIWLGITLVLQGSMSLGTMFGLLSIASSIISPLSALVANGQRLQTIGAHFDRIGDVMEETSEQDPSSRLKIEHQVYGKIEMRNVSFQYSSENFVLQNISLTINPGEKIAIVGETGSGKSTLAMLLLGLYIPNNGSILYDDISLSQLNFYSVRKQIGSILQEPFVMNTSIRENISFGNPDLPIEQVAKAAQIACIHDVIMQMPMKYETVVSEGGSGLSGGQLQRIDIARALANNPPILIMDEATSHLDAATEATIYRNLDQLTCTRIIIAHRLSTIRNADHIIVLSNGQIVGGGKHDDLIHKNKYYSQLLDNQINSSKQFV